MRYQDVDAVNISTLKELWSRSPLHYRHLLDHPKAPTDALELGVAMHMAALEPERFRDTYVVEPEWGEVSARAGTSKEQARDNKLRRNAWWSERAGIEITSIKAWDKWRQETRAAFVSDKQRTQIEGMGAAIMRHPRASRYMLDGGETELPLYWTDEETRIPCKGRLDLFGPRATVGLKSASVAAPRVFQTQAAKYGYHLAWAFYHDGLLATGRDPGETVEIAVEPLPPHDVVVYVIDEETIDDGREAYRESLVKLSYSRETDDWPGASSEEVIFRLPKWARHNDEDDLEDLDWEET